MNTKDTVLFFELSLYTSGNAEFSEFVWEGIEELFVKKTICALDALVEAPSRTRERIIEDLSSPTILRPEDIEEALSNTKDLVIYKDIFEAIDWE